MTIVGTIRDIQPSKAKPSLALYFDAKDRPWLPVGMRVGIVLEIEHARWRGTIATTSGTNPPYVHTRLENDHGTKAHITNIFLELGLAENAKLEFAVKKPGVYELIRVMHRGRWRQGNEPGERRERSPSVIRHESRMESCVRQPSASADAASKVAISFPTDDRDEIQRLANLYWKLIRRHEREEERAFEGELLAARSVGFLSKPMFVRLARWKSSRNASHYESNSEDVVYAATSAAFGASDDVTALRSMMQLQGVALRTASAMMHWMRPDRFPVLDFRVVGALGIPEPHPYQSLEFYCMVAARVRAIAARHSIDLRTIDRALWTWHKEHWTG